MDKRQTISTSVPLRERHWYLVAASFDTTSGEVWIGQRPLVRYAREDTTAERSARLEVTPTPGSVFRMAAWSAQAGHGSHAGRVIAEGFYNGKLEEPIIANRSLTPQERQALLDTATPAQLRQ